MGSERQRSNGNGWLRRSRSFSPAVTNLRTDQGQRGEKFSITMTSVSHSVRIGILGDFNPEFRSHHATNDALQHAAAKLKVKLQSEWIATSSVLQPHAQKLLERFDGLWASPGSPYKSAEGMLKGKTLRSTP